MSPILSKRRFRSICFLAAASFASIFSPVTLQATDTLTVNFADTLGPAGDPIATGFTGGWRDDLPASVLYPIKPSLVRGLVSTAGHAYTPPMPNLWARAESTGATVILVLNNHFDYTDPMEPEWAYHWDSCEIYEDKMDVWRRHVGDWVAYAESAKVVNGDIVPVQYDIWNEPDLTGSWSPNPCYPDTLFYDVWRTAVDTIRAVVQDAVITGPSFSGWREGITESGLSIESFLTWCLANDRMPDVLGWHDLNPLSSDPADPNSVDPGDPTRNLYAQVVAARSKVNLLGAPYGLTADSLAYEINEMLDTPLYQIPAYNVRNFALAERAKGLGLTLVGRAYWCDQCEVDYRPSPYCPPYFQEGRLGGLVQPTPVACGANQHAPRYAWWTYKTYADITGTFVRASSTDSLDAVAGIDVEEGKARILAGNYARTHQEDVRLVLRNIDPSLVVNQAVRVSVKRMYGHPDSLFVAYSGLAPTFVDTSNYLVEGDSVIVEIPGSQFGPGDALSIEVTRITPAFTIAPGDFPDNEAAIQATEVGNTVIVVPDSSGDAYAEDDVQLKNGVRVIAQVGTVPAIVGTGDTVIVFPQNANAFTSFEGIEIQAGPSTDVLMALRGAGSSRNCSLSDTFGNVQVGIQAVENTGEITNCTVEMTIPGAGVTGIWLDHSDTRVSRCTVNARNGNPDCIGISTGGSPSAVVESTLVKAEAWGIAVSGPSIVRFCTVDSTFYEGIVGSGSFPVIENCIATNVLHTNPNWSGITGPTVNYCIAPDGVNAGWGAGNTTEDPRFCGSGDYSLRADSYGSSENNGSGELIGAFPVECLWGSLVRNVTWDGTKPALSVLGDATVPTGKTLTIGNGGVLKFATTDNQASGADTAKAELVVNGSFTVAALQQAARFTSAASPPGPGNWGRIRLVSGASVSVDSAIVEYGDWGMEFVSTAAGTVKHCKFKSNATYDIHCSNVGGSSGITIEENQLLTAGPAGIGLLGSTSPVTVKKNVITRAGSLGHGIKIWEMDKFSTPLITENTIQGFFLGAGIYLECGSPTITKNTISTCSAGIQVQSADEGIPLLGQNGVNNSDNIISNNSVGISCQYSGADPVVRENKINSNTYGVTAKYGASPDLGRNAGSRGQNNLSGNSVYCIWNRNTGGNPEIKAQYNYFGGVCEQTICWMGEVDTNHELCTPPAGTGLVEMEVAGLGPEFRILRVAPNPTLGGSSVVLWLDGEGGRVTVDAYDVAGRLIRRVVQGAGDGVGLQEVHWDGLDAAGSRVPAGIYFLRVWREDGRARSAKVLVMR